MFAELNALHEEFPDAQIWASVRPNTGVERYYSGYLGPHATTADELREKLRAIPSPEDSLRAEFEALKARAESLGVSLG